MDEIKKQIIYYISHKESGYATIEKIKSNIDCPNIDKIVYDMVRKGELIYTGKKYKVNKQEPKTGIVRTSKSGIKFVMEDSSKRIDINNMSQYKVLDNDIVKYRVINNEAYICSVEKRHSNELPFQIDLDNGKKCLKMFGGKYSIDSSLFDLSEYNVGDALLINVEENTIVRKLANKDNPNKRDIQIGASFGFDNYYSQKYLDEIQEIQEKFKTDKIDDRTDFRELPFYTVDCDNTRDIDDSTSFILSDHNTIYKIDSFADTTHYIPYNSEIYRVAFNRGTSAYSPRYVFPMLHTELSNNICSLNPKTDRFIKYIITEFDMSGKVLNRKIGYGVMNSKKKMKYSEVDKILTDDPSLNHTYLLFKENLLLFKKISDQIGNKLIHRGKIEFANNERNVVFNENLEAEELVPLDGPISRKMIEYAMIDANEGITSILSQNKMPLIYRNHKEPNKETLDKVMNSLSKQGFDTDVYFKSGSIQAFLNQYKSDPFKYQFVSNFILGSSAIKEARYSDENEGHWALGSPKYARFSSSIRRLDDFHNHYCFDAYMNNDLELLRKLRDDVKLTAEQCYVREKASEEYEKECYEYEMLDIAKNHMNVEFKGIVTSISNGKTYVKLDNGLYGIMFGNNDLSLGDIITAYIYKVDDCNKEIYMQFTGIINQRHSSKKRVKKR